MPFLTRRELLTRLALVAPMALGPSLLRAQTKVAMEVFKDPGCSCCEKWVAHMSANGFAATVRNTSDMAPVKKRYKVPTAVESCHTAIISTFVIEGHVPADDVKRLLSTKPAGVIGLAIPGMPASAPGMDVTPFQPYTVLAFDAAGKTTVFARHTKA